MYSLRQLNHEYTFVPLLFIPFSTLIFISLLKFAGKLHTKGKDKWERIIIKKNNNFYEISLSAEWNWKIPFSLYKRNEQKEMMLIFIRIKD